MFGVVSHTFPQHFVSCINLISVLVRMSWMLQILLLLTFISISFLQVDADRLRIIFKRRVYIRTCCGKKKCGNSTTTTALTTQSLRPSSQNSATQASTTEKTTTKQPKTTSLITKKTTTSTTPTSTTTEQTTTLSSTSTTTTTTTVTTTQPCSKEVCTDCTIAALHKPNVSEDDNLKCICGREYKISSTPVIVTNFSKKMILKTTQKTWYEAYTECCSKNMQLLRLEIPEKKECIFNAFNDYGWKFGNFWTASTSGNGIECGQNWTWCPNDVAPLEPVEDYWLDKEPSSSSGDHCGVWQFNSNWEYNSKLWSSHCADQKPFICELNVGCSQKCPKTCVRNETLFDEEGRLKNPDKYGAWWTGCGKTYLSVQVEMSYADHWKSCCDIGMSLIKIDNEEDEVRCLGEFNTGVLEHNGINYITSGIQTEGRDPCFYFCPGLKGTRGSMVFIGNNTRWTGGSYLGENEILILYMEKYTPFVTYKSISEIEQFFAMCEGDDPR